MVLQLVIMRYMFGGLQVADDEFAGALLGEGGQHAAGDDLQRGAQAHTQARPAVRVDGIQALIV